MAPTTTIETITITRPLKVIAFICGFIVIVLMIMALTSTDWLLSEGWRQGLFVHCVSDGATHPLPFNIEASVGCYESRDSCELKFYENSFLDLTRKFPFLMTFFQPNVTFFSSFSSLHQSDCHPVRHHPYHRRHLHPLNRNRP